MNQESGGDRKAGRDDAGEHRKPADGPSLGAYAGHGLQFALSILVFLYAGQWLDRKLGTAPWLMLLLMFVGAGASFFSMYRSLMAAQERDEAARKARKEK